MAHNEGAMNLLKQDVTNQLNYYTKVMPFLSCSKNDLIKKAESIENKLNANKNGRMMRGRRSQSRTKLQIQTKNKMDIQKFSNSTIFVKQTITFQKYI